MATIKKSDIYDGNTSKAEHITRIIDALDGTATTDISISGSAVVDNLSTGNGQTIVQSAELNVVASGNSSVNLSSAGKNTGAGFVLPKFQPPSPVAGSAYYDGVSRLYIYDGSQWISVGLNP